MLRDGAIRPENKKIISSLPSLDEHANTKQSGISVYETKTLLILLLVVSDALDGGSTGTVADAVRRTNSVLFH